MAVGCRLLVTKHPAADITTTIDNRRYLINSSRATNFYRMWNNKRRLVKSLLLPSYPTELIPHLRSSSSRIRQRILTSRRWTSFDSNITNDDKDHRIKKELHDWWENNSPVIRHAMQGGTFSAGTTTNAATTTTTTTLERFQEIYDVHSEYQDLFIHTKGYEAVLYSFHLIGIFWRLELVSCGPIQCHQRRRWHVNNNNNNQQEWILRVPYRLSQRPKWLPLRFGSVSYPGWLDLYLKPKKEPAAQATLLKKKNGKDDSSTVQQHWVVCVHDDRMKLWSWVHLKQGDGKDVLTCILGIPILAPVVQSLRHAHGTVVQHLARGRYSTYQQNKSTS